MPAGLLAAAPWLAPQRHPGHVDHLLSAELKASPTRGIRPLRLGGPLLEVDNARPVDVAEVAAWVRFRLGDGGQDPGAGPV